MLAFFLPLPSLRLPARASRPHRTSDGSSARRRVRHTPRAAWEDALLPPEPSRLPTYISSPSATVQLILLGLSAQRRRRPQTAFATAAYSTAAPLEALPLPIWSATLLRDAFKQMPGYAIPSTPLLDSASGALPASLLATLRLSQAQLPVGNRALAALAAIDDACACFDAAAVEEAPSLTDRVLELRGVLFLRVPIAARLAGQPSLRDIPVLVPPDFAVALAAVARVPCFCDRALFERGSTRVHIDADGAVSVAEIPSWETEAGTGTKRSAQVERTVVPWEVTAEEADSLSEDCLRASLRACDVAVTSREPRPALLRKFVDLMDEVQRRELGVVLAAREGLYGLAGELQGGRSERGRLLQEMRKCEHQGHWNDVVRFALQLRHLEAGIMDITAEPGSYARDLDRDEWYRPNR